MRPRLYAPETAEFDNNGIGVLSDAISCRAYPAFGSDELKMTYPLTGIHYSEIQQRSILVVKPDPFRDPQPYRVYKITRPMSGTVTIYARHIAYDLSGTIVAPFSASSVADALNGLKINAVTDCPFSFRTDKDTSADFAVKVPMSIWSTLGGREGSILDAYGGEYQFDGYTVNLWNRLGADRGVSIRYGKNLTNLQQDENCANCYTGVAPYWTNQDGTETVTLQEIVINAECDYGYTRILSLDLSEAFETAPTEDELRERAEKYMADNKIGEPDVSWKVEFVQLEQTEEYKGTALLERVYLGDTVHVEFPAMGVSATARAVEAEYDCLLERYISVTLGSVKQTVADTIVQQQKEIEKKPSLSVVQGIATRLADSILGANGGAVRMLDTDGDGMPDELYIADNPDPAQAQRVWRYNYMGWAASGTGYNGPFTMGATLADGLLAEFVTAAHLVAGTIQSKDGETFFLDLDNGILKIKSVDDLTGDVSELKQNSGEISIAVQKLIDDGVNKLVTEFGLTIDGSCVDIHRSGTEMHNSLDETGMYVKRSDEVMLQANANGVIATDVSVRNYLIVGNHARFEDYSDGTDNARTACFWI